MLRIIAWSLLAVTVLGSLAVASNQFSSGPLASKTGAPAIGAKPAEGLCTDCHITDPPAQVNVAGGGVEILDLPADYEAGMEYPIRVRIWCDSTTAIDSRKWGFQLTAVKENGDGAGIFSVPDPDTLRIRVGTRSEFATRLYVSHTDNGNRDGLVGPVEWSFSWIAPDPPVGTVTFYVAGNAANGNLSADGGDFIYTNSVSVLDHIVPTVRLNWGDLKRRYR